MTDVPAESGSPADLVVDASPPRRWFVGPVADLFLVVNLAWPLVLLVEFAGGFDAREGVRFWQIYFVTTPHRWITLLLVFGDRERFSQRRGLFLGLLAAVVAVCLGVRVSTGTLTCLLTIDYVWNSWHFAAQHHGVYRLYGRMNGQSPVVSEGVEKAAVRSVVLYAAIRVAGWTWSLPQVESVLEVADWVVLAIALALVATELVRDRDRLGGRPLYLISVMALYSGIVLAVRERRFDLALMLTTASALFHASEYLAVVSWSVHSGSKQSADSGDLLSWLVPRWAVFFVAYAGALGLVAWWADRHWLETWLLVNAVVAFLHYSYDGLIWRRRPVREGGS